jgi:serine phosphatase RsbU (regulator of sigma subunit)
LLPQHVPAFASLDYAGICIQARQVGGDYYDFLNLGPDRLGLVDRRQDSEQGAGDSAQHAANALSS